MRSVIIAFVMVCALPLHAESWRPDPQFQLETSNYMETLTWISGVSYALTQSKNELIRQGKAFFICNPPSIIGSKEIMGILDQKYPGETITSEQAISAIIEGLKVAYPCSIKSYNKANPADARNSRG